MLRRALVLGLFLVGCGDSNSADGEPFAVHPDACLDGTEGVHHGECDGLQFDLHVPPECVSRACGLIVDLHGATMTGEQQEANTRLGALAHGRGYLVLQPWAPGEPPAWDAAYDALDALVVTLAEHVMDVFGVDARRVHITGFSQGGYMTWRMLCRRPDLFASFAPLAATAQNVLREPTSSDEPCASAENTRLAPRPVLYAHGTADSVVLFAGATESVEMIRAAWGLAQSEPVDAGEGYEITRYSGRHTGLLEFMEHDLSSDYAEEVFGAWEGHCFPGSDAPMGCGGGPAWGEAVLRFFEAHPRP